MLRLYNIISAKTYLKQKAMTIDTKEDRFITYLIISGKVRFLIF